MNGYARMFRLDDNNLGQFRQKYDYVMQPTPLGKVPCWQSQGLSILFSWYGFLDIDAFNSRGFTWAELAADLMRKIVLSYLFVAFT